MLISWHSQTAGELERVRTEQHSRTDKVYVKTYDRVYRYEVKDAFDELHQAGLISDTISTEPPSVEEVLQNAEARNKLPPSEEPD